MSMSVMPAFEHHFSFAELRDSDPGRSTRDLSFGKFRNLVRLRVRTQQKLMLAAVISHARQISLHHVKVDDYCGRFEFRDMHRATKRHKSYKNRFSLNQGTISNDASCFVNFRVTMSFVSIDRLITAGREISET